MIEARANLDSQRVALFAESTGEAPETADPLLSSEVNRSQFELLRDDVKYLEESLTCPNNMALRHFVWLVSQERAPQVSS